jgi:hypothetical protein
MEIVQIRDPGWKKVGTGIRDKHPGSAAQLIFIVYKPESNKSIRGSDPLYFLPYRS